MPFDPVFADLVRVFSTTEGMGAITPIQPVAGYRSVAGVLSPGDQFYYSVENLSDPEEWETGRGELQADGTITREPLTSSNGGGIVDLSPGTKTIALTAAAEWHNRVNAMLGDTNAPSVVLGQSGTFGIDSNVGGATIPVVTPLFVGRTLDDADAITIDSGSNFSPGIGCRRYLGSPTAPEDVIAGDQLGYIDFRGYSGTQFMNAASIDAIVDTASPWSSGDVPPTKLRFATASSNDGAQIQVEIMPAGRVEIGAHDGGYVGPDALGSPKLFVSTKANDWAQILVARPSSGAGYAARFHTGGDTDSDYLIAGSSGAGAGALKFSVLGSGVVDAASEYRVAGTKVVGTRQAAIADLAGTATLADVISKVNVILAMLRSHGLIAP